MYAEIIVTGIIISLIFTEFTGLNPAGLIVPGYLVLAISSPMKLLWTFAVVAVTLLIYKVISRFTILYGRRRFAVMVLISIAVGWGISALPLKVADISVIGYLIPGIIAKECDRQGILRTTLSMAFVTAVTAAVCMLLGAKLF